MVNGQMVSGQMVSGQMVNGQTVSGQTVNGQTLRTNGQSSFRSRYKNHHHHYIADTKATSTAGCAWNADIQVPVRGMQMSGNTSYVRGRSSS